MMPEAAKERLVKVRKIFDQFDINRDGRLSRDEMAALVVAVNPRVKFSAEQIKAILDEVFRTYKDFIDEDQGGLGFEGLLRTYDDGAGDVDRDFEALRLQLGGGGGDDSDIQEGVAGASIADEKGTAAKAAATGAAPWAISPRHGIIYENTWRLVDDLRIILKRLETKQAAARRTAKKDDGGGANLDISDDWSHDLNSSGAGIASSCRWEDLGAEFSDFRRQIGEIQARAAASGSGAVDEAFDAHMAVGRTLSDHGLYSDALASFQKASALKATDVRPHFRCGNAYYSLGQLKQAQETFTMALQAAEMNISQWDYLLPQIHVNLGVTLEADGMLLNASEHYREATAKDPAHFRAWKHLGSACFGVGEYRSAERALGEAVKLKPDYADARCDLGSALHAVGDDEHAIQEYQKAIDLKPNHADALYNLGGLFVDVGRYQRAAEMYSKVLVLQPENWRAQLNKSVALLGAGEQDEAVRSFKEALKMTKRAEMYDVVLHLEQAEKRRGRIATLDADQRSVVVDVLRLKRANARTTPCRWLALALDLRRLQKHARLGGCDVAALRREINNSRVPFSASGLGVAEKSIRKVDLEKVLRRLLESLSPENFQRAIKAVNERILGVLDDTGSGRVDLGTFYAIIAPICAGPLEQRKRTAFDALSWQSSRNAAAASSTTTRHISASDATKYLKLLRAVYLPLEGVSGLMEVSSNDDEGEGGGRSVSYADFSTRFDDHDWGFGISQVLIKLEAADRARHGKHTCAVCLHPIIGLRFKETNLNFSLCSYCYSECKVPTSASRDGDYFFKEYANESEALKDRFPFFRSSSPPPD